MPESGRFDAVIVGGGFYGCAIAAFLARERQLQRVLLVECEPALMSRASLNNQARVHNGYHYPRSFVTAHRSRINFPAFLRDWPHAVKRDFTKLYAIARQQSKVNARQFERFCREIGARLEPAGDHLRQMFDRRLIEQVFVAEEVAFDARKLAGWAMTELEQCGVQVRLGSRVTALDRHADGLAVTIRSAAGEDAIAVSRLVFNCTYSGLNQIGGSFAGSRTPVKHELTEMALLQPPPALAGFGVTVMDGPFFSFMPYPARGLHTLSHVRYTPHAQWMDARGIDPYARLGSYARASRADRMLRDVRRYLPAIEDARHVDSLFEVKTVLVKNESDDGRPILFETSPELPGCYSVLGGKIDNVYDVIEKLAHEDLASLHPS